MDYTSFYITFQYDASFGRRVQILATGLMTSVTTLGADRRVSHALVHGLVGQAVGLSVAAAQGMRDLETLKLTCEPPGLFPERAQCGTGYLVLAFHLFDHEFRIGDNPQLGDAVFPSPRENGQKSLVFSEIVGLAAQKLAQPGDYLASRVLDDGSKTGRAGVPARAAVTVSRKPGAIVGWIWGRKERIVHPSQCNGRHG